MTGPQGAGAAHGPTEGPGQDVNTGPASGAGQELPAGAPWETPPDAPAPVPVPIDDPAAREGDGGMPPDTLPPPTGG
ncbi:hypothetical protein [Streptomyces cyaneofuscatus]|uniref:hypothetical protein n=1 Tax=Streptomyces cyaneofuscatus TaxID=66883 RepID=UPI00364AF258